jgi:hypothetical protein
MGQWIGFVRVKMDGIAKETRRRSGRTSEPMGLLLG